MLADVAGKVLEQRGFKPAPFARVTDIGQLNRRPSSPQQVAAGITLMPTGSPLRVPPESPAAARPGDSFSAFISPTPQGDRAIQVAQGRLSLKRDRASTGVRSAPGWLKSVWDKPEAATFERTGHDIQAAPPLERPKSVDAIENVSHEPNLHNLSRTQLDTLRVIGQLDRKFIVCAVPDPGSTSLVVFDQHAVDERIRVERLLEEAIEGFASGNIEVHHLGEDPHQLLFAGHDAQLLSPDLPFATILRRWGIQLEIDKGESDYELDVKQVNVTAVPALLSKRLAANSAKDVKKLVLSYLAFLEEQGIPSVAAMADRFDQGDSIDESTALRWLPKRMLDLINSRACRGECSVLLR